MSQPIHQIEIPKEQDLFDEAEQLRTKIAKIYGWSSPQLETFDNLVHKAKLFTMFYTKHEE